MPSATDFLNSGPVPLRALAVSLENALAAKELELAAGPISFLRGDVDRCRQSCRESEASMTVLPPARFMNAHSYPPAAAPRVATSKIAK